MEFKDRLKALRRERGISQKDLADAIFVSRSAVAKWENGLGIPSRDSYEGLLRYFGLTDEALPLNEEAETLAVAKNNKIRGLSTAIWCLVAVLLCILPFWLMNAVKNGYGFTAEMAVGDVWSDAEKIETDEYVFYYDSIPLKVDGEEVGRLLRTAAVVEKRLIGYQRVHDLSAFTQSVYDEDGIPLGKLYSFKCDGGYHHFLIQTLIGRPDGLGVTVNLISEIRIKEDTIPVVDNGYFVTDFELCEFYVEDKLYTVKP